MNNAALFVSGVSRFLPYVTSEHEICNSLLHVAVVASVSAGGFFQSCIEETFFDAYCGALADKAQRDKIIGDYTDRNFPGFWFDPLHDIAIYTLENGIRIGLKLPAQDLDQDLIQKMVILCEAQLVSLGNICTFKDLYLLDELTGLPNISAFERDITAISEHRTDTADIAAIMYIDINNFTAFNRSVGYKKGDAVLQSLALSLRKSVGLYGKVYRFKGDEFCVMLHGKVNGAYSAIARHVQGVVHRAEAGIQITSTVGVSEYRGQPVREMLTEAGISGNTVERFFERRARARDIKGKKL